MKIIKEYQYVQTDTQGEKELGLKQFICMDCRVNTFEIHEYYMVDHKLWRQVNPCIEGMLCVSCLEERLGRKLTPLDFIDALINTGFFSQSKRLRSRIYDCKMNEKQNGSDG